MSWARTLIKLVKDASTPPAASSTSARHPGSTTSTSEHPCSGYTGYGSCLRHEISTARELKLIDEKNLNALFPKKNPVYTKIRDDNPTRYVTGSSVSNSLLADGCVIEGTVENCVLFRGVKVKKVRHPELRLMGPWWKPGAELDCVT